MVVVVAEVEVVGLVVGTEVVVLDMEVVVVVVDFPPPKVDPISPHLMLEKVTEVPGSLARIVAGLPAVLLHGPELPLSSQFMKSPLLSQLSRSPDMARVQPMNSLQTLGRGSKTAAT